MDRTEFSKIAAAIRTYYPRETILPNSEALELWYEELADLDYKTVMLALRKWVSSSRWSPSIYDLRQICTDMTAGAPADWSEGWLRVQEAIDHYGRYDAEAAFRSFDEITRQAVQRIGWTNLCSSENMAADRASFRQIYETLAGRRSEWQRMPADVRALIEETGQKLING